MKWVFWGSVAIIGYTYVGYALWLGLRERLHARPVKRSSHLPTITIAMVVRNEESTLPKKLQNLAELDYPADRVQVVVVSDGSTDSTGEILAQHAGNPQFHVITSAQPRGKAAGLNDAIRAASGEVVVFMDARQWIEPAAVRLLMENFADPEIGCASGELMLGDPSLGESAQGMGLYWRIEKKIRELESASGSVVGATGAIYAARRELLVPVPACTILDDVYLPMSIAQKGARVVFDSRARAWDSVNLGAQREFSRKVRTLSGNYQLLQLAPWILTGKNPLRFEFISHKLLRLVIPFALALALLSSALIHRTIYLVALVGQVALYGLALLAIAKVKLGPLARIADPASTFVTLNVAAFVAFIRFFSGQSIAWTSANVQQASNSTTTAGQGGRS
jgi:cellulose synthase/poly-beta-1,6-N-acetylglucosamine synthase-like glycosyltransferase